MFKRCRLDSSFCSGLVIGEQALGKRHDLWVGFSIADEVHQQACLGRLDGPDGIENGV